MSAVDSPARIASLVSSFVDEVNSGLIDAALARFSSDATIVEDIAPFKWQGRDAGSQWLTAMAANAKRLGVTSVVMDLGAARRIEIEERYAYAIFAGTVLLEQKNQMLREPGLLTFALEGTLDEWLITALIWTGDQASEVAA